MRNPGSTPGPRRAHYLVGLIGEGIRASLTPAMHEAEATEMGLDYEYRILDLIELGRPARDVGAILTEAGVGWLRGDEHHPPLQAARPRTRR
jgi:shikimate dehydrogenase